MTRVSVCRGREMFGVDRVLRRCITAWSAQDMLRWALPQQYAHLCCHCSPMYTVLSCTVLLYTVLPYAVLPHTRERSDERGVCFMVGETHQVHRVACFIPGTRAAHMACGHISCIGANLVVLAPESFAYFCCRGPRQARRWHTRRRPRGIWRC